MKEIKLTIDGKEVQLTDEQLRMLGIETEKKNPFNRVNDMYFSITSFNEVAPYRDHGNESDSALYDAVNYFTDEAFAKQVALHQLLYRKLLKFAYENGIEDTTEWDGRNPHWVIRYNEENNTFALHWQNIYKSQEVYFSSEEDARRAIKEVVEPFIKEHLEFVW